MEKNLANIHSKTLNNLENVHTLKAEWSHLNQPARLEDLGRRLLKLKPARASQNVDIEDIPFRPIKKTTKGAVLNYIYPPAADQVPPMFAQNRR